MPRLDDSVVLRRIGSEKTHVAEVGAVTVDSFIKPYWAPTIGATAACGVDMPLNSVVMATGTKVRCRACVHITGITEQSPVVHERLGAPTR